MTTKIAITDDHLMIIKGIETMLADTKEIEIVGTYQTGSQTIDQIGNDAPDVLLLDINLPDIDGISLTKKVLKILPEIKIIALTNYEEVLLVKRILAMGAHGYLLKNTHKLEIIEALKVVLSGDNYLQKSIESKLLNYAIGKKPSDSFIPKLTRREKEVLRAVSEELTTQEISDKLFISPKTVETHRMNIMSKLGAKNSVGLIKAAIERGLLDF